MYCFLSFFVYFIRSCRQNDNSNVINKKIQWTKKMMENEPTFIAFLVIIFLYMQLILFNVFHVSQPFENSIQIRRCDKNGEKKNIMDYRKCHFHSQFNEFFPFTRFIKTVSSISTTPMYLINESKSKKCAHIKSFTVCEVQTHSKWNAMEHKFYVLSTCETKQTAIDETPYKLDNNKTLYKFQRYMWQSIQWTINYSMV